MTTSKPTTLADLERAAAEAAEHAEQARAQAEKERAAEEDRRRTRLIQYDRDRLASYDDQALELEVLAAAEQYRQAVLEHPVNRAAIRLRAAMQVRYVRHGEAVGDAARLGMEFRQPSPPVPGDPSYAAVSAVIQREASRVVGEYEDQRTAEREAAASG